jgi:hypothetical protein
MSDNYSFLLKKLDDFIRKYYVNKLLKGALYSTAIILIFFLVIVLAESQFYFTAFTRKVLFFSFIATALVALFFMVLKPLLNLNQLGEIISRKHAAEIIGIHFQNVEDKLLNILQLKEASLSLADASLVEASILQKSNELKPVPFSKAVDLQENKKYLKYVIPPVFVFILLLFFKPTLLKDGTNRLIQNNTSFEKPMPFKFLITNEDLKAVQFEDFKLNVKLEGEEFPFEVFIVKEDLKNVAQKLNVNNFSYVFSNLQSDIKFHFEAAGFRSEDFIIDVVLKPLITNFQLKVDYPDYVGLKDISFINNGDISVPEGSKITWLFDAQATDQISMQFSDVLLEENNKGNNAFLFNKTFIISDKYIVKIFNKELNSVDSSAFNISVVSDAFPDIDLEEYIDSTNSDVYFYIGNILDDYGLTALKFNYTIEQEDGKKLSKSIRVPFTSGLVSEFSYYWNMKEIGLKPGNRISYYFEVFDNDKINGSKSSRSKWMTLKLPSIKELEDNSDKDFDEIKKDLLKSIEESKDIQKELKALQSEVLQKKDLTWEIKKETEDLVNKQKSLQNQVEKLENKFSDNVKKQSEFKEVKPEIKMKQEQVQKLFDAVMDDEMKAMIEKLEKLMKEMNKEDALEKMEDMQVSDEDLEKELDRMLELLKKLELEQKMTEIIDKLEDLAKEQQDLANETRDKNSDKEELKKKQEELNKEFDDLKDDLAKIQEDNEEMSLEDVQDAAGVVDEDMDNAKEQLSKNKMQDAAESQKDAAKKMEKMAQSLDEMMQGMQMASMEEDMKSLRQLLENLLVLSLAEESLLKEFKVISVNTPRYISLVQEQFKIIDDSELVEDSLYALAKRVFEMESFITNEIKEINRNLSKAVEELEERKVASAIVNQQYVMTGYNNLALMLSEVMEQMQQQMAQEMQGNQMCENPGNKPGKKPGKIPSMKQMQQQLSDQISQMSEMKGKGENGQKPGESKKLAEMAAKQQAIRQALEDLNQQENKDGNGSLGNLQKIIDEMNQTESDLVNKKITNELINRQQEILTRLLEAENAEKERDEKEERESISAKQYENNIPPSLEEYLKKQKGSVALYKNIPPKLKPYYRVISEKYVQNVFNNN